MNMKTITFYSYKGGTGRTLALANLAVCLSRLGKNVCVLDFDFEAPGLHHKLANSLEETKVECGALDYIWEYVKSGYTKLPDSIRKYARQIKIGSSEENGIIHLIPAGNVQATEYREKITSSKWHTVFCFMREGLLESYPSMNKKFFEQMKENIEAQLVPKPDYLLVDSRTGIIEKAGVVCTQLWADKVVYLFLNNQENKEGIRLNWDTIKNTSLSLQQEPIRPVFALTRIPASMDEQRSPKLKEDILKYLNNGIEDSSKRLTAEDICVLHSDRELELEETLHISQGSVKNTLLSHEYINLFAHIIPEEAKGLTQIDHILSFFRQALGLAESPEEVERVFTLYLREGTMLNPVDKKRNVSLRAKTLIGMLNDIYKSIKERLTAEGKKDEEVTNEVDKSFFDSGLICGKSFGQELINEVWRGGDDLTIQEKFNKWCIFDSEVGLGRFSNEIKIDSEKRITSGNIILRNNPFACDRASTDPKLCSFMTGYIQGVLRELAGTEVKVTHKLKDCMQYQPSKKECDFYFRRVE